MSGRGRRRTLVLGCVLALAAALVGAPDRARANDGRVARVVVERVLGGAESARRTLGQWLAGLEPAAALDRPYAVAWDGNDLLVADPGAGRVVRFDARGRERGASAEGVFEGPIGLAVCRWGILVADSRQSTVTLLDHDLRLLRRLATGLARPTGVACDDDRLYLVETGEHHVLVLRPDGSQLEVFGSRGTAEAEYNFPAALARDGDSLLVGDTLNFRIQRLRSADGRYLSSFGRLGDAPGETPRIKGITVDPAGRIWVSDAQLDQIAIFGRDGRLLGDFGRTGSAPGEFSFPAGLAAADDGRVAVVDSLNRRVQVLRLELTGAEEEGRHP